MITAAQMCFKAADVIARQGHAKGILHDEDTGAVCASGAMCTAALGKPSTEDTIEWYMDAWNKAAEEMNGLLAERGFLGDFIDYNDDDAVTGEDVILLLKETGARLEGK